MSSQYNPRIPARSEVSCAREESPVDSFSKARAPRSRSRPWRRRCARQRPRGSRRRAAGRARPRPTTSITLTVNGTPHTLQVEDRWTLVEALRDHARADRHEDRLRPRRVRRVHGAAGRQAGVLVQPARRVGRRPNSVQTVEGLRDDRLDPAAAGVRRARRAAVRLLHVRSVDEREGAAQREPASDRRPGARGDDRQHLPLLGLQPLRRSGRRRGEPDAGSTQNSANTQNEISLGDSAISAIDGRASDAAHRCRRARRAARRPTPATSGCPACSTRACCAARTRTRASAASTRRRRSRFPA